MDSATQNVLDTIIEAQSAAGPSGAVGLVRFGEDLPQLRLQRQVRHVMTKQVKGYAL
jgi:hypothetical protein